MPGTDRLRPLALLFALVLGGCYVSHGAGPGGGAGRDGGTFDGGATPVPRDAGRRDAGRVDGGGTPTSGPPVGFGPSPGGLTPADYACRGRVTAPSGSGRAAPYDAIVTDFFNGDPVERLEVHAFGDDTPTADCSGACALLRSDAAGIVTPRDAPGSWAAYRILRGTGLQAGAPRDYVELLQYHVTTPPARSSVPIDALQEATLATVITLVGSMQEPGAATLLGGLTDCGGEPIANAVLRVFDATGEIPLGTGRSGPRAFYFNGDAFPSAAQPVTHVDGLFGALNVPVPAGGRLRVELWGALGTGPQQLLGCEAIEGLPDGVTVIPVGPVRADGPPDCTP
ncbi:MAG: hypothetical protein H6719_15395 [Sandaracinaceae bacterium]|nr:hypothetical protein [Sandaracinaceae bacterium]